MSQVRKGTIHRLETGEYESITESCLYHYVDGLRLTQPRKLWELARQINEGVFLGEARVRKESVLDALPSIPAQIAYFDPPYPGVMSYEKEYGVLDQMLEGTKRPTSPFTAKDGAKMIDELLVRARHIPVWILSLGNAVAGIEELEAKMTALGRETRAIEIAYKHLAAVATEEKKATNKEFLVIGWDEGAVEALHRSLQMRPGTLEDEGHGLAASLVQDDVGSGCSQRSSSKPLSNDGLDEGNASLPKKASPLAGKPVAVANRDLDHPRSVRTKRAVAGDRKRRLEDSDHEPQVPSKRGRSQRRRVR
jgi:hypothetical protein